MATANLYDYDVEAENLRRRQALLDAMQSQSMQSLQPSQVGGMGAAPHWTQAAAKLLQAYGAQKGQEQLQTDRQTAAEKYRTGMQEGFENYFKTAEGQTVPGPNPDGSAGVAIPGNQRKAIFDALASGHPVMREFAMQQMKDMGKDKLTAKDLLPYAEPSSIPQIAQAGMAGFQPKRNIQSLGEQFWDVSGNAPKAIGGVQYGTPATINGDLYQQQTGSGKLTKLDNAPKVTTNVSMSPVIKGQVAGQEAFWKQASKQIEELGGRAQTASDNKQTLAEMKNLDSQGVFSNVTSGPATFLSNLGEAVGVKVDKAKLGNTETFNALTTDLWQGLVAKYGGNRGVTKEEAAEIKNMLPLATSSPQARQQLYRILENVSNRQIQQFQNANKTYSEAVYADDPRMFKLDLEGVYNPQPQAPSPVIPSKASAAPLSLEQYLKSKGQ